MHRARTTYVILSLAAVCALALSAGAIAHAWRGGAGPGATNAAAPESGSATESAGGVRAEGRVSTYPGGQVTVGTELAGTLVKLTVEEKSVVKKGDVLAELQASEHQAALEEARAQTRRADLESWHWGREHERARKLLKAQALSRAEADRARHERSAAWAQRRAALAAQKRVRTVLDKLRIVAPIDGVVITRHTNAGETVQPGAPLVTIADLGRVRIEAEVDEFDAGRVALGADVIVTAEGYPGSSWRGRVEDIPDAVLPRLTKPADPRRASDMRVLLVKIAFSEPTPLKLGQRVEVQIRPPSQEMAAR
jgi:HlyD family secretion protein